MFIPPTYQAASIFDDKELDTTHECLCGKEVKLAECIACYTHRKGSEDYGWYAACHGNCIVMHVTEGSA